MIIVFTVETYTPLLDGVQTITSQYAEALVKRGHKVTVITGQFDELPYREEINGVNIIRVHLYTKKSLYFGKIDIYKKLIIDICQNADVLVNVCLQTAFSDVILGILDTIPCKKVLYLHGMAHFHPPKVERVDIHDIFSWLLNLLRWKPMYMMTRNKIETYDGIIHLNQYDATVQYAKDLVDNTLILENTSNWEYYYSKVDSESDYICVSNYMHDKNQEFVLKAYYLSKTKRGLVFIGSKNSPYLVRLKKLKKTFDKKYGEKKVVFIVGEPRNETHLRFKNAYAFLFGSKSEKYPVVLCEAMRNAVPFISTDVGVVKHLPGGVVIKTPDQMAKCIDELDNSTDERSKLGKIGLSYAKNNQDFLTNLERLELFLKRVIKEK